MTAMTLQQKFDEMEKSGWGYGVAFSRAQYYPAGWGASVVSFTCDRRTRYNSPDERKACATKIIDMLGADYAPEYGWEESPYKTLQNGTSFGKPAVEEKTILFNDVENGDVIRESRITRANAIKLLMGYEVEYFTPTVPMSFRDAWRTLFAIEDGAIHYDRQDDGFVRFTLSKGTK